MAHKPTLGYNGERAALLLWLHPHGYPSAALGRDCPCAHLWLMQLCCQQCAIASRGLLWRATPRFALIETGLKAFVCFVLNNLLVVSLQQPLLLAYSLPGFIFAFYLVKRGEKNTEKKKKKTTRKWNYKTTNIVKREIQGQAENFWLISENGLDFSCWHSLMLS